MPPSVYPSPITDRASSALHSVSSCVCCVLCVFHLCVNLCAAGLQNLETQHRVLVSFCGLFLLGPPRLRDRYGSVVTTDGFNEKLIITENFKKELLQLQGLGKSRLLHLTDFCLLLSWLRPLGQACGCSVWGLLQRFGKK